VKIAAVTAAAAAAAAVGAIVWEVLWHLFLPTNRLSISTTFGRPLSFLGIVVMYQVVVVVGLIPTTGPPTVVTRVTKTNLLIVIHEVIVENGGGMKTCVLSRVLQYSNINLRLFYDLRLQI